MDIVVVADDGNESAVFGAFAVEVALDEGVDDAVDRTGSKLALGEVSVTCSL